MTINRIIVVILVAVACNLNAQKLERIYFDGDGMQTLDKRNSNFYREGKVDKGGFTDTVFLVFNKSGKPFGREIYKDTFLNGPYVYFHENGKVKERGIFRFNARIGYSLNYYDSGRPQATFYYPEGQGQISDFLEYDFLIINYWDSLGNQLVNNGNGYCDCNMTYKTFDYLDLTNNVPSVSTGAFSFVKINGVDEVRAKGKVRDGLRDSVWTTYDLESKLIYKESFIKGKLEYGESYRGDEVFRYTKFIQKPESGSKELTEFYNIVGSKMRYPAIARRMGIEGTVFVQFTTGEDGSYDDLHVVKGIGAGCDEEAIRVIKLAEGKFIPVRKRGQPMKSRMVIPLIFKLG